MIIDIEEHLNRESSNDFFAWDSPPERSPREENSSDEGEESGEGDEGFIGSASEGQIFRNNLM